MASKPGQLMYLPDHVARVAHITREGDFLIHTEAQPTHVEARNTIPVRRISKNCYRVFVTEIKGSSVTLPFCTVTVDKKAVAK